MEGITPSEMIAKMKEYMPTPPGSRQHPLKRHTRLVDPKRNPTQIVGIPKIITEMAEIKPGDELSVWMELCNGKIRIIFEK